MIFISAFIKGTRDFLAVEAAGRRYLYLPPEDKTLMDARLTALREGRMQDLARLQQCELPPLFFHNDLHDLESLWWIAIWKILNYNPKSAASSRSIDASERAKQREHAKDLLFHQPNQALDRSLFLRTRVQYSECLAWMQFDALKRVLDDLRTTLVDKCSKFEAGFPGIQMQVFEGVHSIFRDLLEKCRSCIREARLRTIRKPATHCQSMNSDGSGLASGTQKLTSQASGRPAERENRRICYSPCVVVACADRTPRPGKRKRDEIDDELFMRPARMAR